MTQHTKTKICESDKHLQYAEHIASLHKARLTPIRRHIYKCLAETDKPLGAYDILDMLDGVGASKPPTVYRTLDWLIEVGLAKKIESVSKYIAKTSSDDTDQLALLLCGTCGRAEPFDAGTALQSLESFAKSKGFTEHQTVIEIIGQCAEHCQ